MLKVDTESGTEVSPQNDVLQVAIVEDIRSLRDGFRMLIDGTEGFHCVGSFRTMKRRWTRFALNCQTCCSPTLDCQG